MVWPVVTAARPPGGRGREDVPLAPQNRVAEGVSRPRRQGRGPRTATRVRLSHCPQSEDHGVFPKVTLWEGCDHAHDLLHLLRCHRLPPLGLQEVIMVIFFARALLLSLLLPLRLT